MARPRVHAALTLLALGVYRDRFDWLQRLAFLAGGLFIDGDHLVDLALARLKGHRHWRILPLHGWELALLLLGLAWWRPSWRWSRPAAAGLFFHLTIDQLTNRPAHPAFFSLVYRGWHGFRATRLTSNDGDGRWIHQRWWQWL